MSINLYGFSTHQIFKTKLRTLDSLRKKINAQLPDHLKYPELFELFKTYQVHGHARTCWKYSKNECSFSYGRCFTEKRNIAKPLCSKLSNDKEKELLT